MALNDFDYVDFDNARENATALLQALQKTHTEKKQGARRSNPGLSFYTFTSCTPSAGDTFNHLIKQLAFPVLNSFLMRKRREAANIRTSSQKTYNFCESVLVGR